MKESEDVQKLIRLKRYETPGEDYYVRFAEEFKDRQRAELLKRSSTSLLMERFSVWLDETPGGRWAVPAGAVALAIGAGILITSNRPIPDGQSQNLVGDTMSANETIKGKDKQLEADFHIDLPKGRKGIAVGMPPRTAPGTASGVVPVNHLREL